MMEVLAVVEFSVRGGRLDQEARRVREDPGGAGGEDRHPGAAGAGSARTGALRVRSHPQPVSGRARQEGQSQTGEAVVFLVCWTAFRQTGNVSILHGQTLLQMKKSIVSCRRHWRQSVE